MCVSVCMYECVRDFTCYVCICACVCDFMCVLIEFVFVFCVCVCVPAIFFALNVSTFSQAITTSYLHTQDNL